MGIFLLAALIAVPLIEIGLFIEVGGWIGLWPTLALVILTAVLGSWQLRVQGLATLARARQQLDRGQLPARELFDGFCLVIAGGLLLTPGFLTDALGLALFVPAVRELLRDVLASRFDAAAETRVWVDGEEVGPGGPRRRRGGGPVIDGEYRDVSEGPEDDSSGDSAGDSSGESSGDSAGAPSGKSLPR